MTAGDKLSAPSKIQDDTDRMLMDETSPKTAKVLQSTVSRGTAAHPKSADGPSGISKKQETETNSFEDKTEPTTANDEDQPVETVGTPVAGKRKRISNAEGDDEDTPISKGWVQVKRPRTPDSQKGDDDDDDRGSSRSVTDASSTVDMQDKTEADQSKPTPEKHGEKEKKVTNPFLKPATQGDLSWDDIADDEDKLAKAPPTSKSGTPMKNATSSRLSTPASTPGIQPSSLGLLGSSLGKGSWSNWADAAKQKDEEDSSPSITPPSGTSPTPIPMSVDQRSATSTPQKTKMSDYVFGSSFGGTGFAAIAASGKTAFGSASSTPKSTFASLASTNQPSEAGQKTEGQDAFSTLLSTPHKAKTDKDLAGNPNTEEDSAPGTPMLTPMKPEVAEQKATSGEEGEETAFQTRGKLFVWDASEKGKETWRERGKGHVKVNVSIEKPEQGRLLMRSEGSLKVILNTKIFAGMHCKILSDKYVEFIGTSVDDPKQIAKFLLQFAKKEQASELKDAVDGVLESCESSFV